MSVNSVKLLGKYIIEFKIESITGLHIGTANSVMEIGGVDNPVIKDALGRPYIPGSSLKGKMRSLMELAEGLVTPDKMIWSKKSEKNGENGIRIHMCGEKECPVCNLFGRNHGYVDKKAVDGKTTLNIDEVVVPTRIIVRDAYLIEESITDEMKKNMDMEWTEVKFENNLDRITSAANPRQTERVPAGAIFESEIILNVFEVDGKEDGRFYLNKLVKAMKLLEDDYIGGGGSRGYGKIAFKDIRVKYRDAEFYRGNGKEEYVAESEDLNGIIEKLNIA